MWQLASCSARHLLRLYAADNSCIFCPFGTWMPAAAEPVILAPCITDRPLTCHAFAGGGKCWLVQCSGRPRGGPGAILPVLAILQHLCCKLHSLPQAEQGQDHSVIRLEVAVWPAPGPAVHCTEHALQQHCRCKEDCQATPFPYKADSCKRSQTLLCEPELCIPSWSTAKGEQGVTVSQTHVD